MTDLMDMAESAALDEAIRKAAFAPIGVKRIRMREVLCINTLKLAHELGVPLHHVARTADLRRDVEQRV